MLKYLFLFWAAFHAFLLFTGETQNKESDQILFAVFIVGYAVLDKLGEIAKKP